MKWFVWIILNIFLSGFCLTIFIYKDAVFLKDQFVFYKLIGSGDHFPAGPLLDGSVLSHIFLLPEKILISKEFYHKNVKI